MPFKATITIDGEDDMDCLHFSFALRRDTDATGKPTSDLYGGTIHLTAPSTEKTKLLEWMCQKFLQKSGHVTFLKVDEEAELKTLYFEDAYIVQYSEQFDYVGDQQMNMDFVISARTLRLGNAEHVNKWPTS